MRIADFSWGWIGTIFDNEIEIVSTKSDPPKIRLAVQSDIVESNLGSVSFNLRRPDGNHEEYGYVMGRLTADRQQGALYVALRARGEEQSRQVLYLDPGVLISRVPIMAPNIGSASTGTILRAPGGQTELHMQGDGNLVTYDVRTSPWTPLWSSMQGKLRDFREDGQYSH